jgi:uncharacterized protein (TIGR00290 family)
VEKAVLSWSGGKDCALAFHRMLGECMEVVSLLTTVTKDYDRVSMHGIRRMLLHRQAEMLGMHLIEVEISKDADNDEYQDRMKEVTLRIKGSGIHKVAFGDIFLEDVRRYREENLAKVDMDAVFPLWNEDTCRLSREFLELGFRAVVTCVDTERLDAGFAGRFFDEGFLADLPSGVDPSGENGEFHTFVFDGPVFERPVGFDIGERVLRDGRFQFCDLVPKDG